MSKSNVKETITQDSIDLLELDAKVLKDAIIESNFIDSVLNQEFLDYQVKICFNVNWFLIENQTSENIFENSLVSSFYQGYYELCKNIYNSKVSVLEIDPELLKNLILHSKIFGLGFSMFESVMFYNAIIQLVDSMLKNEVVETSEKRRIIVQVMLYNEFLKSLSYKI